MRGHQPAEPQAHTDVVQAPVQILQQAPLQTQVRLLAREQVLDDGREPRAAARELHHARRHGTEEESSQEHALGQSRAEFQVGREVAPQRLPVLARFPGRLARFGKQRARRQVRRANGVVQALARDRVHQARGIAHRHPAFARHPVLLPRCRVERRQQMAVEGRALPGDAALGQVPLQAFAQGTGRLALSADSHREMPAARKDPDVAFQPRQKLDVDARLVPRHVIAQRRHGVFRREFGAHLGQRVAGARRYDTEIRVRHSRAGAKLPSPPVPRHFQHARLFDLRPGPFRALQ